MSRAAQLFLDGLLTAQRAHRRTMVAGVVIALVGVGLLPTSYQVVGIMQIGGGLAMIAQAVYLRTRTARAAAQIRQLLEDRATTPRDPEPDG